MLQNIQQDLQLQFDVKSRILQITVVPNLSVETRWYLRSWYVQKLPLCFEGINSHRGISHSALPDRVCFTWLISIRYSDMGKNQVPCYPGVFHGTVCSTLCGVRIALVAFGNMRFG